MEHPLQPPVGRWIVRLLHRLVILTEELDTLALRQVPEYHQRIPPVLCGHWLSGHSSQFRYEKPHISTTPRRQVAAAHVLTGRGAPPHVRLPRAGALRRMPSSRGLAVDRSHGEVRSARFPGGAGLAAGNDTPASARHAPPLGLVRACGASARAHGRDGRGTSASRGARGATAGVACPATSHSPHASRALRTQVCERSTASQRWLHVRRSAPSGGSTCAGAPPMPKRGLRGSGVRICGLGRWRCPRGRRRWRRART